MKGIERLNEILPENEMIDLTKSVGCRFSIDNVNVEPKNQPAFALKSHRFPEIIEIKKSELLYDENVNLLFSYMLPISSTLDLLKTYSSFFNFRNEVICFLQKHTSDNSVKIIWKHDCTSSIGSLMESANAYELRAYVKREKNL